MEKILEQPIKNFDFAYVVSEKRLKESGLGLGDEVMVMSMKDVATLKTDPYLKRTYFIVAKVVDDVPQIPTDRNEYKGYLLDPRSLEKVEEERGKHLRHKLEELYGVR